MTRKINKSHLSKDECEKILAVIQRDCNLRQKEQERLSKIEEELNEKASQRSVLAKRKEFNEKWCILCCSTFNLLFNKKFYCHDCHFYVCRHCAVWESQEKIWLCRLCEHQRILYIQSCEWFYDHVRKKFKHFGSSKIFIKTLHKKRKESDSENDSGYGPTNESGTSRSVVALLYPRNQNEIKQEEVGDSVSITDTADSENDSGYGPTNESGTSRSVVALLYPRNQNEIKQEEVGDSVSITESHCSQADDEDDMGEIRHHIETVVEGLIGGTSLDTARVDCLYDHPLYDQLFAKYHSQLASASVLLCNALQKAMQSNTLSEDEITPTAAHSALKYIINEVIEDVQMLPIFKDIDESSQDKDSKSTVQENSSHSVYKTYNDLLAAAIINKLVEMQQEKFKKDNLRADNDLKDSNSNENSSDDDNLDSNAKEANNEFTWVEDLNKPQSRIEYIIEEIEEITQDGTDSEEDRSSRMSIQSSNHSTNEIPLGKTVITSTDEISDLDSFNALDVTAGQKVPFPEFGMDIVELSDDQVEEELGAESRVVSVSAWEENWLFRKKRLPVYSSLGMHLMASYGDPPSMFIPNPIDDVQVLIGSRHLDQLSELSETNSVGSLVLSSDDNVDEEISEKYNLSDSVKDSELKNSITKLKEYQQVSNPSVLKNHSDFTQETFCSKQMMKINLPKYIPQKLRKSDVCDPVFLEVPESQSLHAGKIAHFVCQAKGTKPIGVAWFRDEQYLSSGAQYSIYSIDEKHILDIYDINLSDSDTYSCCLYNEKGENWRDFTLKVKFNEISDSIGYGEWLFEITNLQESDEGEYSVIASNKMGQASSSVVLIPEHGNISVSIINQQNRKSNEINSPELKQKKIKDKIEIKTEKNTLKFTECKEHLMYQSSVNEADQNMESNSDDNINDLNAPPRPGTIAEREHKKWLNAIPLRNNPYSAANIAKRLGRRRPSVELSQSAIRPLTFEEFECQQQQNNYEAFENVPILNVSVDPSRYQRDYYINHVSNETQKKLNVKYIPEENSQNKSNVDLDNEEALNSLEEKVYISTGKVFTLEDHVRRLEREVQLVTSMEDMNILENETAKIATDISDNDKQISHLEEEIFKLKKSSNSHSFAEANSLLSNSCSFGDEKFPSLPSVRDLANKFMPSKAESKISSETSKNSEKKVIVIDKTLKKSPYGEKEEKLKVTSQNRVIHSLTARNLSREVRKQAQNVFLHSQSVDQNVLYNTDVAHPSDCTLPTNESINLSKKNMEVSGEAFHGYTSDESTTSNHSSSVSKAKRKTSKSILQRATYWEKRAEQSLLSDSSVCEDFPAMENIPN
ncbi:uncharacterized protein LOC111629164 [Centruroides sculpturatus]|uniref:uncharacterized protein LOC111629164 n=1 Tax=Centruroides sculpturatus TaxID=218467 RepID=UPI000C6E4938|nr:uncharacterized protein LOC111629164 [Centruroides sculpturatus]